MSTRTRQGEPVATLARELGSKPLPLLQILSNYYFRKKTNNKCRGGLLLLTKMHQGQSKGLVQYRSRKLSQILKYAYQHYRYYRNLMDEFRDDSDGHLSTLLAEPDAVIPYWQETAACLLTTRYRPWLLCVCGAKTSASADSVRFHFWGCIKG